MLFSFVLPAYKAKYLAASIESILSQTYKEFELIIVNDASPEDLDSIVNSFKDRRISYYKNKENIGRKDLVKQWNYCIKYAIGDYIILASDDDIYTSEFLSTFKPLIIKYPQVNIFRARSLTINANSNIYDIDNYYKEYIDPDEFKYLWFKGIKGGIANYIFKKETLFANGGFINFPLAWGSDDASVLLLADKGIVTSCEHLFFFRRSHINISSIRTDTVVKNKIRARMQFSVWRENYQTINTHNKLTNFYQEQIYIYQDRYKYYSIYEHLKELNLFSFITFIPEIYDYKLLSNKQKSKLVRDISLLFIARPFIFSYKILKKLLSKILLG